MSWTYKSNGSTASTYQGKHRFEHWYRDNQVYFITARVRDRTPAFACEEAKVIFWKTFDHAVQTAGFVPWITSLLDNHYHTLGYLKVGLNLPRMMQTLHGVTAKKVNDLREASGHQHDRLVPFWSKTGHKTYFDGCIRDESQARRAYRYTQIQSVRHGITNMSEDYPHTRVNVGLTSALKRATELKAYLSSVDYKRYRGRGT